MSGLLLPDLSALRAPYGISLITKLGGFSILMALAGLNKWQLSHGVSKGNRRSLLAFQTTVLAEWILILAIVTVTAVMTSLFSPDH
jgi:putative copper export protein